MGFHSNIDNYKLINYEWNALLSTPLSKYSCTNFRSRIYTFSLYSWIASFVQNANLFWNCKQTHAHIYTNVKKRIFTNQIN